MKKRKTQNGNSDAGEAHESTVPLQHYDLPEGYKEKSSDLVGFWNPAKGPLHFIPRFARAFDSKLEAIKHSVIIMGEAVGAHTLTNADHEDVACESGDMIGVWYKPGMNAIKDLADVRVFMFPSGQKDTGKPNPMVEYSVSHAKDGNPLLITDDFRKKSIHTSLPFPLKNKPKTAPAGDDNEDFSGEDTSFP
jgi:hypothetical protein